MADQAQKCSVAEEPTTSDLGDYLFKIIKSEIVDHLKEHDWMERMRLKARAYIKNNGTKSTTVDEVVEVLTKEALETFPMNVKQICANQFKEMCESLQG